MKNQNNTNARISKDGKFVIVAINGQTGIVNINLMKYLLGIPYTKKDGTSVTELEIASMKQRSQEAYGKAILSKASNA